MESRKYTNASGRILLTQKWNGNTINYYGIQYMISMGVTMLNSRLAEIRQQANPPFTGASAGYGDFFVAKPKMLSE